MAPKDDDADDVPMLSPVADSLTLSPARRQLGPGSIIAIDNSDCMIDLGDRVIVEAVSKAADKGYQNDIDPDNSSFNSAADWAKLEDLKAKEGQFWENIKDVRCSERYGKTNRRTCLLRYEGYGRDLRCSDSSMAKLLTAKKLKEYLDKITSSGIVPAATKNLRRLNKQQTSSPVHGAMATKNHEINSSASVVKSVETLPRRGSIAPKTRLNGGASYTIVAKNILACRRSHAQQVTDGTRCIVRDQDGLHEYMTWSQIQQKEARGEACFPDEDYGQGLHPKVDREFLDKCRGGNKLDSTTDINVHDAIIYASKDNTIYYITVFWSLKDNMKAANLYNKRKKNEYDYEGPIRSSSTSFLEAGGRRDSFASILEKRQPDMWTQFVNSKKKGTAREGSPTPQAYVAAQVVEVVRAILHGAMNEMKEMHQHCIEEMRQYCIEARMSAKRGR
ncbi:hypothetical protein PMIN04_012942 [Paraphaeosphaeria minitans]